MPELVEIEHRDAIAIVRLRAGKANALTRPLLDAIEGAIDQVERAGAAGAVITGEGSAFCAGLALPELIDLDRTAMLDHIARFEQVMRRVLTTPVATVAAVNGHAIAGGCVLALMCDERWMASGTGVIGLNEVRLGIGLPSIVVEPALFRWPGALARRVALEGELFGAERAAALGVVERACEPVELLSAAIARARELGRSPVAYAQIKRALLHPVLAAIDARAAGERESWLDTWFSDDARRTLRAAVDRITARR